jgi:hypothetical protein
MGEMYDDSAKYEEEIPVPEDMEPDQAETYRQLIRLSRTKESSFEKVAAEIIARDPNFSKQYLERHRKQTVEKVAAGLSDCRKLVDLPVETVSILLELPPEDAMHLTRTVGELANAGVKLTPEEVKEAVDLARVIHIMEEEQLSEEKDLAYDLMKGRGIIGQARAVPAVPVDYEGPMPSSMTPVPDKVTMAREARSRLDSQR